MLNVLFLCLALSSASIDTECTQKVTDFFYKKDYSGALYYARKGQDYYRKLLKEKLTAENMNCYIKYSTFVGMLLYEMGKYDEALTILERAYDSFLFSIDRNIMPQDLYNISGITYHMAKIYQRKKEYNSAVVFYRTAISFDKYNTYLAKESAKQLKWIKENGLTKDVK